MIEIVRLYRCWRLSSRGRTVHGGKCQVSPQRLVHYRDNCYLNVWCHLRGDVRSFRINAISCLEVLDAAAKKVSTKNIDQSLGTGYCIFNGAALGGFKLRFTLQRARWVADESWHPLQESAVEADGSYLLSFSYFNGCDLFCERMGFGADVQVLAPAELRSKVQKGFLEAAARYV